MKRIFVMLFGVMVLCAVPLIASANSYMVIETQPGITWEAAQAAALALPGDWDLATITSAEEQLAVNAVLAAYYNPDTPDYRNEFWIGGEYLGGWTWVTGETWSYTNWWDGEPNNVAGIEPYLALDWRGAWMWNDEGSARGQIVGYVAESVPEPATMLLLGSGLLGMGLFGRKRVKKHHL